MTRTDDDDDDDKTRKLCGSSWKTSEDNLKEYFTQYGQVSDCIIIKNCMTNQPRGFGFIEFEDVDSVNTVMANGPHYLDGKTIDPQVCRPRSENLAKKMKRDNEFQIFLGGLQPYTTEMDIRNAFSEFGSIADVSIVYDKERGRSKGYGFLTFQSEDSAQKACDQRYVDVNGGQIECKAAVSQDRSSAGFSYRNRKFPRRQNMTWTSQEASKSYPTGSHPMSSQSPYSVGYGNNWGPAVQQPYIPPPPPPPPAMDLYNNSATCSPTGSGYEMLYSYPEAPHNKPSDPSYTNAPTPGIGQTSGNMYANCGYYGNAYDANFLSCPDAYNVASPVYTTGTMASAGGSQGFYNYNAAQGYGPTRSSSTSMDDKLWSQTGYLYKQ